MGCSSSAWRDCGKRASACFVGGQVSSVSARTNACTPINPTVSPCAGSGGIAPDVFTAFVALLTSGMRPQVAVQLQRVRCPGSLAGGLYITHVLGCIRDKGALSCTLP